MRVRLPPSARRHNLTNYIEIYKGLCYSDYTNTNGILKENWYWRIRSIDEQINSTSKGYRTAWGARHAAHKEFPGLKVKKI